MDLGSTVGLECFELLIIKKHSQGNITSDSLEINWTLNLACFRSRAGV